MIPNINDIASDVKEAMNTFVWLMVVVDSKIKAVMNSSTNSTKKKIAPCL